MGKEKARKSDIVDELFRIIDEAESRSSRAEYRQTKDWLALVIRILGRLNCTDEGSEPVEDIVGLLKSFTGFESVDLRLREGEGDASIGRTESLSPTQSQLTSTNGGKGVDSNPERTPHVECLFTTIISGETDSSLPFFTERGSFWANSRSDCLSAFSARGLHGQCDDEGYESLALIPVHSDQELIGVLELKDPHPNRLDLTMVRFLENIGVSIGIALARTHAREALEISQEKWRSLVDNAPNIIMIADRDGAIEFVNRATPSGRPEEGRGENIYDYISPEYQREAKEVIRQAFETGEWGRYESEVAVPRRGLSWYVTEVSPIKHCGQVVAVTLITTDITDLKKAEETVRLADAELRQIFNTAADGMRVIDKDFSVVRVNRTFATLASTTEDDAVGKKCYQVLHGPLCHTPGCVLRRILGGEERVEWEGEKERKDGSRIPCILTATPFRGPDGDLVGIVENFRDISERSRAERVLRESEARYKTLFETAAEGILISDIQTRKFKYANPAVCRMLGFDLEELENMLVDDIHPREFLGHVLAEFEAGARGEKTFAPDIPCLRKDGTVVYADTSTVKASIDGKECNIGFFTDITERKKAEKEKATMEAQLRQAQKMEAVGRLAGGMAHDFNNLLTAIRGYSDLALMKLSRDGPACQDVEHVREASIRAAKLTEQLLLFSRPRPMVFKPLNLNKTISGLLNMLKRVIGENVSVITDLDPVLRTVHADVGHMEQIVMNMVVNAKDAMSEGGEITIKTENVEIDQDYCKTHSDARTGEFVCVSVGDTGVGMDNWTISHVFEPFFTTKDRKKGTGLGLSVAYGIVRQHKGWIDVESAPGQGSTFRICLPSSLQKGKEESKDTSSNQAYRRKAAG
ncbi:PAS domain S-box protein [candidate division TA06 bacterium]|uniref:histidine kinase n=1 Tax=candidate division TA06 bacterium TaxID=2250710 RepID=A0A523USQ4_UNCT6|nr:MAG: PAS domain S-box protein [candidate division TA06 bacterium]